MMMRPLVAVILAGAVFAPAAFSQKGRDGGCPTSARVKCESVFVNNCVETYAVLELNEGGELVEHVIFCQGDNTFTRSCMACITNPCDCP